MGWGLWAEGPPGDEDEVMCLAVMMEVEMDIGPEIQKDMRSTMAWTMIPLEKGLEMEMECDGDGDGDGNRTSDSRLRFQKEMGMWIGMGLGHLFVS